ncbi:MAG: uracil-DNA glycosylase [Bacteroidales bacterium]|jgi:DNA polymerase|nr:uracil-DNA glycosylase [Bacteroidales bacterium]MDD2571520.1 uracil-DNA glycosylase [Bacteroidales bacterium]MDD2813888.1 uracil-DNA glycosylase [Bacteroidales bacterium]MDD3385786.1 uracil-DNA glycosylase [Bacteroidales bacterium]MDD3812375.1 uracil-DNA glycosylase [Bacteroidales bacterium]
MIEEQLSQMDREVQECTRCELYLKRTQAVLGGGNPFSELMLIGEGPGEEEDRQGVPFVGKSGQLLDKILAAAGFSKEENVYITNIVKCRPPGNREPNPEERAACLPFLMRQIELIQPGIIVLLGSTALKALINPEGRITKMRGKWITWNGIQVIPTYHPSALLRNPDLKKDVWEDFKSVVQKYREEIDPHHHSNYT